MKLLSTLLLSATLFAQTTAVSEPPVVVEKLIDYERSLLNYWDAAIQQDEEKLARSKAHRAELVSVIIAEHRKSAKVGDEPVCSLTGLGVEGYTAEIKGDWVIFTQGAKQCVDKMPHFFTFTNPAGTFTDHVAH